MNSPLVAASTGETPGRDQRGSALIIMLIAMLGVGALTVAHLTKVVAENNKVRKRIHADRAQARADAELEYAKNLVNAAPYSGDRNTALVAALTSDPPLIPGTNVEVRQIGDASSHWFALRSTGRFQNVVKTSQGLVRQRSPVSAYNFFVIDHPLGISGAPRGAIHSNKSVDFYFPWGLYRDQVTASEGFNYRAGATPENTRLIGQFDPNASTNDLLEDTDLGRLADKAETLKVTDDLIAEVHFLGKNMQARLFSPERVISVPKIGERWVFSHYETVTRQVREPIYKTITYFVNVPVYETRRVQVRDRRKIYKYENVTGTYTRPVYEWQTVTYYDREPVYAWRTVTRTERKKVWVEDPPPDPKDLEGGFAVGSGKGAGGHWEFKDVTVTEQERYISTYKTVRKTRRDKVKVRDETYTETKRVKTFSHYEYYWQWVNQRFIAGYRREARQKSVFTGWGYVWRSWRRPRYRMEPYTYMVTVKIPERLERTETVKADGIVYIEKGIRKIEGKVNGQVSLITNGEAKITGSIQYVDNHGNTRMQNGLDPTEKYEFNPSYEGDSVLGIMAKGDIRYATTAPQEIEINASMISTEGTVSFEGIQISDDGKEVTVAKHPLRRGADYVKRSIRRLGGIVTRKRPVTTYVDGRNNVIAGFENGVTLMDRNLLIKGGGSVSPPFVFQRNIPTWTMETSGRALAIH